MRVVADPAHGSGARRARESTAAQRGKKIRRRLRSRGRQAGAWLAPLEENAAQGENANGPMPGWRSGGSAPLLRTRTPWQRRRGPSARNA